MSISKKLFSLLLAAMMLLGVMPLTKQEVKAASTTMASSYYSTCPSCKKSSYFNTKTFDPDCTEKGYTVVTCTYCGYNQNVDYVDAVGHIWYPWVIDKEPGASTTGFKKHLCSVCGITEYEIIPALIDSVPVYSVTFDNQGANVAGTERMWYLFETVVDGVYYYADAKCSKPIDGYYITCPQKTGYFFVGYFTEKDGKGTQYVTAEGKCINNIYATSGSKTLYAKWTPNTYKVTLDNKGADTAGTAAFWYKYNTVSNGAYYYKNAACTDVLGSYTITCPTKKGYTFGGYFTGENGTGTQYINEKGVCVNSVYKTIGSKTLYAKWEHTHNYTSKITKAATCTQAGVMTYSCICGSTYTTTIPATGHSFGAWVVTKEATASNAGVKERKCSKCGLVESIIIDRLPTPTYRVTFDNQGASVAGTASIWYKYNAVIDGVYYYSDAACTKPIAGYTIVCPKKDGYTFDGYFTEKDGKGTQYVAADGKCINNIYQTAGSKTLYAKWTPNTYKITLDNKGATTAGTTAFWYKYDTVSDGAYYYTNSSCTAVMKNYTIVCPVKSGYTFGGYFTGENGTGTMYVNADGVCVNSVYKTIGSKTLYAKWTENHVHSYTSKITKAATCTTAGIRTYTCPCGSSYTTTIAATGHKDGEWKVTKPATTTSTGVRTLYCAVCGAAIKTESIPKLPDTTPVVLNNHNLSLDYKATTKLVASKDKVEWSSSNTKVAVVDQNGNVKTVGTGTATITVKDLGNNTTDSCKITVSYTWWQWIVRIVLFGWIWY